MPRGRQRILSDEQRKENRRASRRKWYKKNPQSTFLSNKKSYAKYRLDYKYRVRHLWTGARNRAAIKKVPFDITVKYLIDLYEQQGGLCPITKRVFDLSQTTETHFNPNGPSIDRIHSDLGYVKGNVRFIIHHLNMALNEYGQAVFEELIRDYQLGVRTCQQY